MFVIRRLLISSGSFRRCHHVSGVVTAVGFIIIGSATVLVIVSIIIIIIVTVTVDGVLMAAIMMQNACYDDAPSQNGQVSCWRWMHTVL